jgi:hypothetical protein
VSSNKHEEWVHGQNNASPDERAFALASCSFKVCKGAARTNEWLQEHVEVLELFLIMIKLREKKTSGRRGLL